MRVKPRPRGDAGFTLVELLLAIVVLGIIAVPLGDALISFFRNTTATSDRLAESHDAQISSAYFAQDVQSIGVRDWSNPAGPYKIGTSVETINAAPKGGTFPCGLSTDANAVVRMAWDDPTGASTRRTVIVSYVVRQVGTEKQLHRMRCDDGTSNPTSDLVLAHNVLSVGTPVLTGPQAGIPQSISVTLTLKAPSDSGSLPVILFGQRRETS
jgi:prepilin-type N-terminal cleavage/methylation domain-containing protein